MRLSEVAKHLAVTAATASDAVTSLVDKGLVKNAIASRWTSDRDHVNHSRTADSDTNSVLV